VELWGYLCLWRFDYWRHTDLGVLVMDVELSVFIDKLAYVLVLLSCGSAGILLLEMSGSSCWMIILVDLGVSLNLVLHSTHASSTF
jgi:hypothetical protein